MDKTKMDETRAWVKESGLGDKLRSVDGVKDLEISFCPGLGYLAARYVFTDLDDMVAFFDAPELGEAKEILAAYEHFDTSREVLEFKGFFCEEL